MNKKIIKERFCLDCKKLITTKTMIMQKGSYFCSKKCRKSYNNTYSVIRKLPKGKPINKVCSICNDVNSTRRKYCVDCIKRIKNIQVKERFKHIDPLIKERKRYLAGLSDEDFYNEVSKKLMNKIDEENKNEQSKL